MNKNQQEFWCEIMLNEYINTQSPIVENIGFLFSEPEELDTLRPFWQNTEILLKFDWITPTIVEDTSFPFDEKGKLKILKSAGQNIGTPLELISPDEESEYELTQELADTQRELPAFPFYNEEDIFNLDAVIFTPLPCQSGTIRVKLIYEEPSKPFPVENPWEK